MAQASQLFSDDWIQRNQVAPHLSSDPAHYRDNAVLYKACDVRIALNVPVFRDIYVDRADIDVNPGLAASLRPVGCRYFSGKRRLGSAPWSTPADTMNHRMSDRAAVEADVS